MQDFAAARRFPIERVGPAQGRPGAVFVDPGREIFHPDLVEDLGGGPAESRHVVVHGRPQGKPIGPAHPAGDPRRANKLFVREAVGLVHVPGRELHPPGLEEGDELGDLVGRPRSKEVLQAPGCLDVPTELGLVRVAFGGLAEFDDIVQVFDVVLRDPRLKVGVADVRVGMGQKIERPFALRRQQHFPLVFDLSDGHLEGDFGGFEQIGDLHGNERASGLERSHGKGDGFAEALHGHLGRSGRPVVIHRQIDALEESAAFLDEEDGRLDLELELGRGGNGRRGGRCSGQDQGQRSDKSQGTIRSKHGTLSFGAVARTNLA